MENNERYTISLKPGQAKTLEAIATHITHENRKLSTAVRLLADKLEKTEEICKNHKNLNTAVVIELLPILVENYLNTKKNLEDNLETLTIKQLSNICKDNPDYYKGWSKIRKKQDLVDFMRSRQGFIKIGDSWIV